MNMMIKRLLAISMAILILCLATALAESDLTAAYSDGAIDIRWNANGECVLTVYRNDWPISVCTVRGEDGGTKINVGKDSGRYTIRLQSADACLTAGVTVADIPEPVVTPPQAVQTPDALPEETPVPDSTQQATSAPTITPVVTKTPVVTATPIASKTPMVGQNLSSMAAQVVAEVNAERAKAGLAPLSVSSELTRAAEIRAREIMRVFSHTRPDGTSWSTVSSVATGENIAKGHNSAERVMAAWMSSEGHRANILRERFGSIGVCALKADGIVYWVQLFGR